MNNSLISSGLWKRESLWLSWAGQKSPCKIVLVLILWSPQTASESHCPFILRTILIALEAPQALTLIRWGKMNRRISSRGDTELEIHVDCLMLRCDDEGRFMPGGFGFDNKRVNTAYEPVPLMNGTARYLWWSWFSVLSFFHWLSLSMINLLNGTADPLNFTEYNNEFLVYSVLQFMPSIRQGQWMIVKSIMLYWIWFYWLYWICHWCHILISYWIGSRLIELYLEWIRF